MTVEKLNRQRVLHLLDAIARSDLQAALACCTDDVDFLTHAPIDVLPHMGPCHGKKELGEFWRTVQERYAEIRYEAPQIVAEGDAVAAYLRVFFRKRSNDRIIQVDMAVFYTFRNGQVAQIREIIDSYDLVQQVLEREIGPLIVGERVDGASSGPDRKNTGSYCKSHTPGSIVHCKNVNCVLAELAYFVRIQMS